MYCELVVLRRNAHQLLDNLALRAVRDAASAQGRRLVADSDGRISTAKAAAAAAAELREDLRRRRVAEKDDIAGEVRRLAAAARDRRMQLRVDAAAVAGCGGVK